MYVNRFTTIRPGDMLLVDFGSSTIRCQATGRHPAYVVAVNDPRAKDARLMVIPAFRKASYTDEAADVRLDPKECKGIRYEMFVNATNIQKVERHRVIRKIGCVSGDGVLAEVRSAVSETVDGNDTPTRQKVRTK